MDVLRINADVLPMAVMLYDQCGRAKYYVLKAAGRKKTLGMQLVGANLDIQGRLLLED